MPRGAAHAAFSADFFLTSSCARFGVGFGRLGAAFDGSGKHIDHHRAKPFFFSVLPGAFCHGQLVVFAAGTPFSISISSGRPIHTLMITSLQQVAARAGAR